MEGCGNDGGEVVEGGREWERVWERGRWSEEEIYQRRMRRRR